MLTTLLWIGLLQGTPIVPRGRTLELLQRPQRSVDQTAALEGCSWLSIRTTRRSIQVSRLHVEQCTCTIGAAAVRRVNPPDTCS
jgi:hypothetical protein